MLRSYHKDEKEGKGNEYDLTSRFPYILDTLS